MSSFKELLAMRDKGYMGQLLARTFHGTVRPGIGMKELTDVDFYLTFETPESVPEPSALTRAIVEDYRKLGFEIREQTDRTGMSALIYCERNLLPFLAVAATTQYLFNSSSLNVRVSTQVSG